MVKVPKGYRSKNVRDTRSVGGSRSSGRGFGGGRSFGGGGRRSPSRGTFGGGNTAAQRRPGGCGTFLVIGLAVLAFIIFSSVGGGPSTSDNVTSTGNGGLSGGSGASEDVDSGAVASNSESQAEEDSFTLINFVLDDLQMDFWPQEFEEAGLMYEDAIVNVFENGVNTGGCGSATSAVGPFYCPADDTAYIDIEYMFLLQRQLGAEGDFSQAYILAHEIGHHVQNLLGINSALRQAQSVVGQVESNALQVSLELQADCFAGAWARNFSDRGFLDEGDLDEGVQAAGSVGDDAITGSTNQENFTHGSSAQRIEWFTRGFEEGTDSCTTFDGELSPG